MIVEAAAEGVFQLWRVLCSSSSPLVYTHSRAAKRWARGRGARAVAKLYAMMVLVPGSRLLCCMRRAAESIYQVGAGPHWLVAVVAYPVLGAWAAFTAFVKFAFVVFALNTLAGFGTSTRRAGSSGRCFRCASRRRCAFLE